MTTKVKPEIVTEEHLEYLDDLRESGETNVYGAPAYLEDDFGVTRREARDITSYWMSTFEERQNGND